MTRIAPLTGLDLLTAIDEMKKQGASSYDICKETGYVENNGSRAGKVDSTAFTLAVWEASDLL